MRKLLLGGVIGAVLSYVFDPNRGHSRRALLRDRSAHALRQIKRRSGRGARGVSAGAYGLSQKVRHRKEEAKPQPNDATLAHKVETEIFRAADVPKGKINVNAENGVVYLRGEADRPELIEDLEKQVRKIPGVKGVENLLHLSGTPAPHRGDSG